MFNNDTETNLNEKHSDNDEDCSCSSCECSSFSEENNNTMSFQAMTIYKYHYPTSNIFQTNHSFPSFNKSDCFSINSNHSKEINKHQSEEFSTIDLEYIYKIINQSYTKLPILYKSIKQIKLDSDFILSVNNYFDRLKSNIYKDLIRRETLLRNGKNHTRNFISFIHCICKISYEQAVEISKNLNPSKYALLYIMKAIDYILQNNFPQKKSLFYYILNEYISMWLHENLRMIQEDFCIIEENERKKNFFSICICILKKLESICAINWERLQMIQNYRLTHFDQLFKPTNIKLETNKDFILLFGKSLKLTMKNSYIPITPLYSNRTENELINIDKIHQIFRKSIAKILQNHIEEDQKVSTSIPEKPTGNIISETQTQSTKPILLSRHLLPTTQSTDQVLISSPSDTFEKQQSQLKLVSLEHQQLSKSIEMIPKQNTLNSIHKHQSSSESHSSSSHSQSLIKSKIDTSPLIKIIKPINNSNESKSPQAQSLSSTSTPIILLQSDFQKSNSNHPLQEPSNPPIMSPKKSFSDDHLSHSSNKSITTDSKAILNTEINALINFLTKLAYSPSSIHQKNETSPLLIQLESCLKENNIDSNLIIENIRNSHSQPSLNVKDPLFLAEFTRILRKELEDAQILRDIDCGQLNDDSQSIGYLSFQTSNILKLPNINTFLKKNDTTAGDNIDQNRIFIEVIHDPSKCLPSSSSSQHHQFNHNSSPISIASSKFNNQQSSSSSLEPNHSQQQWHWIRSNKNVQSKTCLITPNSLFYARKSFDKNTYSITVEHNEEFQ